MVNFDWNISCSSAIFTATNHASGAMANGVYMRIADGIQQSLHDLFTRLPQAVMQHSHDPVRFSKDLIRKIHGGVFQNVTFNPTKNLNTADLLAHPADFLPVFSQSVSIQSVGHRNSFAVIRYGDVLQASSFGGGGHFGGGGVAGGRAVLRKGRDGQR